MSEHVSDLAWDRWLAGEVSGDEAVAHAATCEACGARMRELIAGRDAFRDRPFPLALRRKRRAVWIGALATTVAAAAAIVLVVKRPRGPEEHDGTSKGRGPDLVLERGGAMLASGDVVHPGDRLQAGYTSDRDGFGAVLSLEHTRNVFAYVPSRGDLMVALPAGELRSFPESTTLDEVVGPERVILLWCELPQAITPLLATLRTTREVEVPGCFARTIDLVKR